MREALHKTDVSVVMSHSSTYAESILCQRIASHIIDCIKEGIRISTDIDNLLVHEHSNGTIFKNIESIYLEEFNKLISVELLKDLGPFFVENEEPNKFKDTHWKRFRPKVTRLLYEQITNLFNDKDQLVLDRAMPNLYVIRNFFGSHIKHRLYHHSGKNNF